MEAFVVTETMVLKSSAMFHSDVPSVRELYPEIWLSKYDLFSGPTYTPRSLLLSAIAVPFYYAGAILLISPVLMVGLFVNSIIIALISLVIFLFSMEIYGSKRKAFILSLIFSVCSFIWPYNTTLYPQPLQALMLIAPAYFLYKSVHLSPTFICSYPKQHYVKGGREAIVYITVAGILLGLSVLAHPSSLIAIPGFSVYAAISTRWQRKKRLTSFLVPLAVVLLFIAFINYTRFGNLTEFGYYSQGSIDVHAGWEGLLGLWISPGFGILFYFPIVTLLPLALKGLIGSKNNHGLSFLIIYIVGVFWLFVGTLSYDEPTSWSGAIAWGPRYMIAVLPFIVLSLGSILPRTKRANLYSLKLLVIIVLCASGFAINLIGKLTWVSYVASYMWEELLLQRLATNYLSIVAWYPIYSLIFLHFKVLTDNDFLLEIQRKDYQGTDYHFVTYGLAPCHYDIYLYCRFGIVPIVTLSGVAALLAAFILKVKSIKASTIQRRLIRHGA
ncbi:MAG: hypothetical protein K0R91_776 [Nitrososphaeraceae archaeon]|nr:hypothetical protein [Nitrososphaeraceae archaeon]